MNSYTAIATDLTHLGGSMGTEYTTIIWIKNFKSLKSAKLHCEAHYKSKLTWTTVNNKCITTGDLGWIMYDIKLLEFEK